MPTSTSPLRRTLRATALTGVAILFALVVSVSLLALLMPLGILGSGWFVWMILVLAICVLTAVAIVIYVAPRLIRKHSPPGANDA